MCVSWLNLMVHSKSKMFHSLKCQIVETLKIQTFINLIENAVKIKIIFLKVGFLKKIRNYFYLFGIFVKMVRS